VGAWAAAPATALGLRFRPTNGTERGQNRERQIVRRPPASTALPFKGPSLGVRLPGTQRAARRRIARRCLARGRRRLPRRVHERIPIRRSTRAGYERKPRRGTGQPLGAQHGQGPRRRPAGARGATVRLQLVHVCLHLRAPLLVEGGQHTWFVSTRALDASPFVRTRSDGPVRTGPAGVPRPGGPRRAMPGRETVQLPRERVTCLSWGAGVAPRRALQRAAPVATCMGATFFVALIEEGEVGDSQLRCQALRVGLQLRAKWSVARFAAREKRRRTLSPQRSPKPRDASPQPPRTFQHGRQSDGAGATPVPVQTWVGVSPVPVQMWQRVFPVPAQMWQVCSQSRANVAAGVPSPSADVGRGEPSPREDVGGVFPVPAQMWHGEARKRTCRISASIAALLLRNELSFALRSQHSMLIAKTRDGPICAGGGL
jgi:hypothetical protein